VIRVDATSELAEFFEHARLSSLLKRFATVEEAAAMVTQVASELSSATNVVVPTCRAHALWRLTQRNDFCLFLDESMPCHFDMRLHSREDRRVLSDFLSRRQSQL
jgi:hypothetical protein